MPKYLIIFFVNTVYSECVICVIAMSSLCFKMNLKLFFLLIHIASTFSASILGLFPLHAKSHFLFAKPLLTRLAERGHVVTVYTPYPDSRNGSLNYTEVDISMCNEIPQDTMQFEFLRSNFGSTYKNAFAFPVYGIRTVADFEQCEPLMKLLRSTKKYDLMITESFTSDAILMYANKFGIPFISTTPNSLSPFGAARIANPANPSYIPVMGVVQGYVPPLDFQQRVTNTLAYVISIVMHSLCMVRQENAVIRHFLGSSSPSLYDIIKNTSLVFTNSDPYLNGAVPMVPNVVPVSGLHITQAKKLPQDLEKFINESSHGVVYFCMGSISRGSTFPEEKRKAFLNAFAKLPQRVLWKWEQDTLPGKSDNIMISKWMPQRDVLAHPNVKLFISHGGLLGMSEAVYEGVPILGIPIFGDQSTNMKNIEQKGAGETLEYEEITETVVFEKVSRLVNNPVYKKNAVDLSVRYKDRPMSPLDTAVYWTEYVIRHKGAHHLKTAAVNMPWYQYLLLDVIAFLAFTLFSTLTIIYYLLKSIYKFCRPSGKVKTS